MINNKLLLFIAGFIIGLVISFFVANSQYQNQTTDVSAKGAAKNEPLPPGHPPVDSPEAKAAITGSKAGPLEAFGAKKTADKTEGGEANSANEKVVKMEAAFKNIKILKGLPANQLPVVMQSFSEALGVKCTYCHVSAEEAYKDEKPTKETARKMLLMVQEINKNYPTGGGVTCFTCHRGSAKPAS